MNNSEKKRQKIAYEQRLKKKSENLFNLIATFILLLACLLGHAREMKQSVLAIFINNPSEGLPYIIIIVISVLIFYLVSWAFISQKYK